MTALEPRPEDDVAALTPVVRQRNAQKVAALIERLEPEVDGSYGPVNPRMIEVYLKAIRELGTMYRVYDRPPPPKEEETEAVEVQRLEVLRAKAEAQLRELASRQDQAE